MLTIFEATLIRYIADHNGETILVKDMAKILHSSKQTASKYINILVNAGIVIRDGKRYYLHKGVNVEALCNG